jgi:hypothetical protein
VPNLKQQTAIFLLLLRDDYEPMWFPLPYPGAWPEGYPRVAAAAEDFARVGEVDEWYPRHAPAAP